MYYDDRTFCNIANILEIRRTSHISSRSYLSRLWWTVSFLSLLSLSFVSFSLFSPMYQPFSFFTPILIVSTSIFLHQPLLQVSHLCNLEIFLSLSHSLCTFYILVQLKVISSFYLHLCIIHPNEIMIL